MSSSYANKNDGKPACRACVVSFNDNINHTSKKKIMSSLSLSLHKGMEKCKESDFQLNQKNKK